MTRDVADCLAAVLPCGWSYADGGWSCVVGDGGGTLGDVRRHTADGQVGYRVQSTGGAGQAAGVRTVCGVPGRQLAVGAGRLRLATRGKRRATHRRSVVAGSHVAVDRQIPGPSHF